MVGCQRLKANFSVDFDKVLTGIDVNEAVGEGRSAELSISSDDVRLGSKEGDVTQCDTSTERLPSRDTLRVLDVDKVIDYVRLSIGIVFVGGVDLADFDGSERGGFLNSLVTRYLDLLNISPDNLLSSLLEVVRVDLVVNLELRPRADREGVEVLVLLHGK